MEGFAEAQSENVPYALIDRDTRALTDRLIANAGIDPNRWVGLIEHLGSLPPDIRDTAWSTLADIETSIFDDEPRIEIWAALRSFISHHRSFPDAEWALPAEEINRVEGIYNQFSPIDSTLQPSWLFSDGVPLLSGRDAGNWEEREEELLSLQKQAVSALVFEIGTSAIDRLVEVAQAPFRVGFAYGFTASSKADADEKLLRALGSDSAKKRGFVKGLAQALYFGEKEAWADRIVNAAVTKGLAETAIVELLLALPSHRSTWDAAAALGNSVNSLFWKDALFFAHNETHEDIEYGIIQMVNADRAPEVVQRIAGSSTPVSSSTILHVLRAATEDPWPTGGNASVMFQWGVARLITKLEADKATTDEEIAQLEWLYLAVLEHSERPARTLHHFMSSRPVFFLEVLSAVFRPSSKEEGSEYTPTAQEKAVASQAWRLLESWGELPGQFEGSIDSGVLHERVEEAHRLAVHAERGGIGDEYIGKLLSHSPVGIDGSWPHPAVRDVIESMRNSRLETGILVGVHNNRGITSRGTLDGGQQERDLAAKYNRWAVEAKLDYPRTSALLREIARSYENHARDFDEEAERNDWEY